MVYLECLLHELFLVSFLSANSFIIMWNLSFWRKLNQRKKCQSSQLRSLSFGKVTAWPLCLPRRLNWVEGSTWGIFPLVAHSPQMPQVIRLSAPVRGCHSSIACVDCVGHVGTSHSSFQTQRGATEECALIHSGFKNLLFGALWLYATLPLALIRRIVPLLHLCWTVPLSIADVLSLRNQGTRVSVWNS